MRYTLKLGFSHHYSLQVSRAMELILGRFPFASGIPQNNGQTTPVKNTNQSALLYIVAP